MGSKPSKIPPIIPGHILQLTGIEEFDKVYRALEVPTKRLKESEIDLNMNTTDFIRSLGAREVWEIKPNVQKLIQVLLVILSSEGNGTLTDMVSYSADFPFLIIQKEKISKGNRKVAENFEKLMAILQTLPKVIAKSAQKLNAKIDTLRLFQNEVAKHSIAGGYNMKDKLVAISIVINNYTICENALMVSEEIGKISEAVIGAVLSAVQKAQLSPHCEILASRGLQAASEGLTKPKDVVNKFWPLV